MWVASRKNFRAALIFCSKYFIPILNVLILKKALYFDEKQLEKIIKIENSFDSILFGHNAAITNFVNKNLVTFLSVTSLPVVALEFDTEYWEEIKQRRQKNNSFQKI
jgi:hypothetical protein